MTERDRLKKDQFDRDELAYQEGSDGAAPGQGSVNGEDDGLRPDEIDPDAVDPQCLVRDSAAAARRGDELPDAIPEELPPGFVELVRYPSRAEVDMFVPWLEEAEIKARVEEIDGGPPRGLTGTSPPRGTYRVMVPLRDIDEAQHLCEEFETQREHMRVARTAEEEPQKIEGGEDA